MIFENIMHETVSNNVLRLLEFITLDTKGSCWASSFNDREAQVELSGPSSQALASD